MRLFAPWYSCVVFREPIRSKAHVKNNTLDFTPLTECSGIMDGAIKMVCAHKVSATKCGTLFRHTVNLFKINMFHMSCWH